MTKYKIVGETLIDTTTNEVIKGVKILNATKDMFIGDNVLFGHEVEVTLSESAKVVDTWFEKGCKVVITDDAVVINSKFLPSEDSVIRVARNAFLALRLDNFVENVNFVSDSPEACHAFEKCYIKDCEITYSNDPDDSNKYRGIHMIESTLIEVKNIGVRFPDYVRRAMLIDKVLVDGEKIEDDTMEVFDSKLTDAENNESNW